MVELPPIKGATNPTGETVTLPDGSIYKGEMADGKPHGHGEMKKATGTVIIGNFHNGLPHG